jgi:hypothetical protein
MIKMRMKDPRKIHVEPPSYWPIVLAAGLALIAIGVVFNPIVSLVGVVVVLVATAGWAMQNREGEHGHE